MKRKILTFILTLSLITPTFYSPWTANRARAIPVVEVKSVPGLIERLVDGIAMSLAQTMIDRMVSSTVKWAQSGFEGNPAYVTDPERFFSDIADGVAGSFIQGSELGFLCSPFQANIRLSLMQSYYEPQPFQCTLTDVVGNIEGFYEDFNQGGWDAWFSMTQNPTNNPYGAYLEAQAALDSRIASALGIEKNQLDWNQGFLSWSECAATNPEPFINDPANDPAAEAGGLLPSRRPNPGHVPGKAVGECIERGPTQTPGSVIKTQLDKSLGSGFEKLITAQHVDQLISGFATGLLTRYVFGKQGIFGSSNRRNTQSRSAGTGSVIDSRFSRVDLDGDGIPEGQDFDRDGVLSSSTDVCFHGGSAPNCKLSTRVTQSPYLTGFCESVDDAVNVLTDYTKFIDKNASQIEGGASLTGQIVGYILGGPVGMIFTRILPFGGSADNFKDKADADLWANRTGEVQSAMGDVLSTIQELRIGYFDKTEISVNRYVSFIDKINASLIADKDLDLAGAGSSGGGGLKNLMKKSAYNLRYLKEVKTKLGKCEMPNAAGVSDIPTPPEEETGGGGSCPVPEGPASLCQGVNRDRVLEILNRYPVTNEGITAALPEIKALYGEQVKILDHPERLDKIDFGGGLVVDVVIGAGGANPTWGWIQDCECGGGGGSTPNPGTTTTTGSAPNERAFVERLTTGNAEWGSCAAGNGVACHRFVREAARALAANNPKWGLLTKGPGEQQCTLTECGRNLSGGFAEDALAYLIGTDPTGPVAVIDIISGAGAAGASISWQEQPRRSGNNWAPVP